MVTSAPRACVDLVARCGSRRGACSVEEPGYPTFPALRVVRRGRRRCPCGRCGLKVEALPHDARLVTPSHQFPLACPWRTRASALLEWAQNGTRGHGGRLRQRVSLRPGPDVAGDQQVRTHRLRGLPFRRRSCRGCGWLSSLRLAQGRHAGCQPRGGMARAIACAGGRVVHRKRLLAPSAQGRRAYAARHSESCAHWNASSRWLAPVRSVTAITSQPVSGSEASGSRLKSPSGRARRRSASTALLRVLCSDRSAGIILSYGDLRNEYRGRPAPAARVRGRAARQRSNRRPPASCQPCREPAIEPRHAEVLAADRARLKSSPLLIGRGGVCYDRSCLRPLAQLGEPRSQSGGRVRSTVHH